MDLLPSSSGWKRVFLPEYVGSGFYLHLWYLLSKPHGVTFPKTNCNWLMLIMQIIAVWYENNTEHTNMLHGQNAGFLSVQAGGQIMFRLVNNNMTVFKGEINFGTR